MYPQDAIDFSREAIKTCLMIGGPILVASLLIGLLVGVFQAMTQVQDQTVSFVPKILILAVSVSFLLPWCSDQLLDFARTSFETPMTHWQSSGIASPGTSPPTQPVLQSSFSTKNELVDNNATFQSRASMPTVSGSTSAMPTLRPRPEFDYDNLYSPTTRSNEWKSNQQPTFQLPRYRVSERPDSDIGG